MDRHSSLMMNIYKVYYDIDVRNGYYASEIQKKRLGYIIHIFYAVLFSTRFRKTLKDYKKNFSVMFYIYMFKTTKIVTIHNELKRRKKSFLAGQCTSKAKVKFFRVDLE